MIFQLKHLIYPMFLTTRMKVIIKHKALIFKQEIKIKLKILLSYIVKILPKLNIF